ncbi:MAG: LacI family DNA-binding transcriptional regulator [Anaerolineales bacterium]|nr:LacI family DNA-binding transcriptional regulator [Anaerolineales bacterium]
MTVTIKDVARKAGVSSATVSRVLTGKPHVRNTLIDRVMKAVEELHYRPSRVARSLREQKSHIIGLIISDIMNPFFTSLVRAVEDFASQEGYTVFLCNSDENVEKEEQYISVLAGENIAGLLITPAKEQCCSCKALIEEGIPVVTFDRRIANAEVDTVMVDNVMGAYQAVNHLIAVGHERIAAVTASEDRTTGRERLEGYRKALKSSHLPLDEDLIFTGAPKKEAGRELARKIMQLPFRPTAIFCGNNLLTMGVWGYLQEAECRIPEDCALVSFDDLDWYTLTKPTITAVRQPVYELGKTAAELLFERIKGKTYPVKDILLEPKLIVRESSGRSIHH